MPDPILSLPDAERLAVDLRSTIRRVIRSEDSPAAQRLHAYVLARVESDLAGLRDALEGMPGTTFRTGSYPRLRQRFERQAVRCSDGLRATRALYPEQT
jgi:hypothetical protein